MVYKRDSNARISRIWKMLQGLLLKFSMFTVFLGFCRDTMNDELRNVAKTEKNGHLETHWKVEKEWADHNKRCDTDEGVVRTKT